ncbi:NlpC/P60 family putative phage cell wall peptidase [Yoonia maritima]|uniref:NlpC/P60 family putative phage cell wall peptidase n=1 Tax=Yoonia maritima TaxID=1435347 RepID=A0A2T0W4G0_9RHOB|nr:peptidase [Yoonia maritima]PRY80364.1 NlpC/P60 family putative phage cell wall peptidase [Yoonia maritima]
MTPPIVEVARDWIGTPYLHQASVRGVGCDCLGLLRGVWRTLYGAEPELVPAYTADWSEPQGQEALYQAGLRHMDDVTGTPLAAGQVLLFRMRNGAVAKHIGILSNAGSVPAFIHSYSGHGVVESLLSAPWRRRIAAQFEISKG